MRAFSSLSRRFEFSRTRLLRTYSASLSQFPAQPCSIALQSHSQSSSDRNHSLAKNVNHQPPFAWNISEIEPSLEAYISCCYCYRRRRRSYFGYHLALYQQTPSTCKSPSTTSALTFPPTPLVFDVVETVHTPLQLAPKSITCACKDGLSLSLSLSLSSRIPTEFGEDENQDFTSLVVKFSHSISVRDTTILSSNVEKLSFGIFNCNECNHFRKSSSLSCSSFIMWRERHQRHQRRTRTRTRRTRGEERLFGRINLDFFFFSRLFSR